MSIAYRDGAVGDGAAVSALFRKAFTATFAHLYSRENLDFLLAQRSPESFEEKVGNADWAFRLAEEGGMLLGYTMLGPNELPGELVGPTWELHHLYLDESAKGRGISEVLVEWGKDEARRRGYEYLQLSVFIDNHRARRFYDKRGWVEVGKYEYRVGDHVDDDRVMRLTL
jgi:ribosomal protein S18 acetylase RimI-like enzyme